MKRYKVERALAARERFFNIGLIAVIAFNDERCFGERQTVAEVAHVLGILLGGRERKSLLCNAQDEVVFKAFLQNFRKVQLAAVCGV